MHKIAVPKMQVFLISSYYQKCLYSKKSSLEGVDGDNCFVKI